MFSSFVKSPLVLAFEDYNPTLLFVFVAILLALLGILYRVRKTQSVKWFALFLFSLAETAIWIGFDVRFQTNVKFFNCTFTAAWAMIVLLMEVVRSGLRSKVVDVNSASSRTGAGPNAAWIDPNSESPVALFANSQFLSGMSFMMLIFQLALATWFALDLRRLDQRLGVDEATHGVIYVYIDAVLATGYVAMIVAAIGSMVLFIAAFAMSGPAVKGVQGGCAGCGGCTNCCYWNNDDFLFLFRESKCLFFNEGSTFDFCDPPNDEGLNSRQFKSQRQVVDQVMQRV